jgi:hypothetical protein
MIGVSTIKQAAAPLIGARRFDMDMPLLAW